MKILCFLWSTVLLEILISSGAKGGSLFSSRPQTRTTPACCNGEGLISCLQMKLHASSLGKKELYLEPLNATVNFVGRVGTSKSSFYYTNKNVDFTVTLNKRTKAASGHATLDDGRSYVLEYCGKGVHAFKEFDEDLMDANQNEDVYSANTTRRINDASPLKSFDLKSFDTTTIVTYTVKVYYTEQFARDTSDIQTVVNQMINEANQGYINSRVPLRVRLHAMEQTDLAEKTRKEDLTTMQNDFDRMKGTIDALRGTADAAILLCSNDVKWAGRAHQLDQIESKETSAIAKKWYIQNRYVFGHEMGHLIGLGHNPEFRKDGSIYQNSHFSDGHGYLILMGSPSKPTGHVSVMAYTWPEKGHNRVINWYSNPNVNLPWTSIPTGVVGKSNNARVLTVQRFGIAGVGDESACVVDKHTTTFKEQWKSTDNPDACRRKCQQSSDWFCVAWYTTRHWKWSWSWSRFTYNCYHIRIQRWNHGSGSNVATGPSTSCTNNIREDSECSFTNRKSYVHTSSRSRTTATAIDCHHACQDSTYCSHWNYDKSKKQCIFMDVKYSWKWRYSSGSGYHC